ncbi:hypothetical protein E3Q06_04397 [Wallemia mellicola]|nr:hypothetical protein E3Q21_04400 [Wallemia mellicola]TIB82639.1 hypothetical protein E3Q20_04403 [Wallemia mellicola]TIC43298.1 hypothetical protein E3Q06_04397 [Wallemia mellicola]TIC49080.1 hypothetical protein E3Q04_04418 [Wallemia mellicola]
MDGVIVYMTTSKPTINLKKKLIMEMFATLKQTYSTEYHRVPFAFKDSMIHCICNSHYLSHFAAFFIDA